MLDIKNKKIEIPFSVSQDEVQKALFDLGAIWITNPTQLSKVTIKYLFIDSKKVMTFSNTEEYFQRHAYDPITVKELYQYLASKDLPPFAKVLVRNSIDSQWELDFFMRTNSDDKYPYECITAKWAYCLPYEGNKHLFNS